MRWEHGVYVGLVWRGAACFGATVWITVTEPAGAGAGIGVSFVFVDDIALTMATAVRVIPSTHGETYGTSSLWTRPATIVRTVHLHT